MLGLAAMGFECDSVDQRAPRWRRIQQVALLLAVKLRRGCLLNRIGVGEKGRVGHRNRPEGTRRAGVP